MEESILNQSRRAKGFGGLSRKAKTLGLIAILAAGGYMAYGYLNGNNKSVSRLASQKTATVAKGDIQLAVETSGTVTAEDGVELSFSTTGETVEKVYVKEGDTVKKGDKIASISTASMQYELRNAQDNYQAAVLALGDAKAGATEEKKKNALYQIEQAQQNLTSAQVSLEQVKLDDAQKEKDAQTAIATAQENLKLNTSTESSKIVDDAYSTVYTDADNLSLSVKNNLYSADKILGIDETSLNDGFESVLSAKDTSYLYGAYADYNQAKSARQALESMVGSTRKTDHAAMEKLIAQAQATLTAEKALYKNLTGVLDNTVTSSGLSQSQLDAHKSSTSSILAGVNSALTSLQKDVDAIDTAKDSLSNLQSAYEKAVTNLSDVQRQDAINLTNAQVSVRNKEIALDQANMSYQDLVAPLTTTELQQLVSKVNQTRNSLQSVQDKISEATLTSPIDGQVGAINGKEGSLISANSSTSFATIINKDTLFVKVSVEESDINQIKKGEKAYVTFDAINGLELEGEVTFISMTAGASNSGVVTYEVCVVLDQVGQTDVKEGMTAYVEFVNSEVKDVLNIPVAAVTNVNGTPSVKMADGSYRQVVTGFTDGQTVEIVSGLKQGEKIVY